jgi:hypothetical protein
MTPQSKEVKNSKKKKKKNRKKKQIIKHYKGQFSNIKKIKLYVVMLLLEFKDDL